MEEAHGRSAAGRGLCMADVEEEPRIRDDYRADAGARDWSESRDRCCRERRAAATAAVPRARAYRARVRRSGRGWGEERRNVGPGTVRLERTLRSIRTGQRNFSVERGLVRRRQGGTDPVD